MPKVKLFEWLGLLKTFMLMIRKVLPLPDFLDSGATRTWTKGLLSELDDLADETTTEIDDITVGLLEQCVNDDELWIILHSLLRDAIVRDAVDHAKCDALAEKVGFDPGTIALIISIIVQVIRMWLERRKEEDTPTAMAAPPIPASLPECPVDEDCDCESKLPKSGPYPSLVDRVESEEPDDES